MSKFRIYLGAVGPALLAFFLVATSSTASAQLGLREATEMLDSDDRDAVNLALEAMAGLGNRAARPLIARIDAGLPGALLEVAVGSLAELSRPEASDTFVRLLRHRRPTVRLAALQGLVRLRPRDLGPIAGALNDGDAQVRSAAAIALGSLGGSAHVDRLFLALDRRVLEAASAIAQVAEGPDLERFFGYLGRLSLATLTPAFQEVFARDNVPEATKVSLIHRLGELATAEVRDYLLELSASLPDGEVKAAAADAAEGIGQ